MVVYYLLLGRSLWRNVFDFLNDFSGFLTLLTWLGEGYTDESYPLILSAKQNNYRSVQMLLKAGADVNKPASIAPCLPFDMANKSGSYGLIKYLTGKGAKASKTAASFLINERKYLLYNPIY